jgi:Protein of unknown function (DUF1761)
MSTDINYPDINYLAVIAAAVAQIVIGVAWYGLAFGKHWAALGVDTATMKPKPVTMAAIVAGALIMSFVLAHSLIFASAYTKMSGVPAGLSAGFWNWLGFIAPVTLGSVLWEGKSIRLWLINGGFYLVSLLVMGVILALWTGRAFG